MAQFLAKRWFLLVLVGGVSLAWWRPQWLQPATARVSPRVLVAPALFLMAWTLESRSLWLALVRPWPALWATALSYGFVPLLAWLVAPLLPHPEFQIGLLISAAVPCTLASAVLWTRMAGGNEAAALLVVLLTTSTSWLATTAWLALTTGTRAQVNAVEMMTGLVLVLVLPVAAGQLARLSAPLARFANRFRRALGVGSRLLILVVMLKAAVDVCARLADRTGSVGSWALLNTAASCVGIHLLALACGWWTGWGLGFDRPNRIAVAFAGSQKTLPVALFLLDAYYQDYPLAVVPMVFYHAGQLIVDTFIADRMTGSLIQEPQLSTISP